MLRKSLMMLLLAVMTCSYQTARSQEVGIKTNILYDATATLNLGLEVKVAPRWSVDLSGNLNAWTFNNGKRWKHWMLQPEARYWLCDATAGHFFAVHALTGQFNFGHIGFAHNFIGIPLSKLKDHRYQGWTVGAGLGYGYSWILNRHWNIEAEIGLGYIYADYDVFECAGCGRKTGDGKKGFFTPTKAAVNIVYVF